MSKRIVDKYIAHRAEFAVQARDLAQSLIEGKWYRVDELLLTTISLRQAHDKVCGIIESDRDSAAKFLADRDIEDE